MPCWHPTRMPVHRDRAAQRQGLATILAALHLVDGDELAGASSSTARTGYWHGADSIRNVADEGVEVDLINQLEGGVLACETGQAAPLLTTV